jgi:hypothetical protein
MAIITGFFDHIEGEIEKQIDEAKRLDIKHISLRNFSNQTLLDLDLNQIKDIQALLKKEKLTLQIVDANYYYNFIGVNQKELQTLFENARLLQTKILILELPDVDDFDLQHENFLAHVKWLLDDTKKKSFDLVFKVNPTYKPGVIAYLINQIKGVKFIFDAGLVKRLKASVTTTYRIMKKNTEGVMIYDIDKNNEPFLLGYGYTGIMEVVRKMNRDKYKGAYILDFNLMDYIENRENAHKKRKFFGLFTKDKKEKAMYVRMDQLLGLKPEETLDYTNMLKIYINVLNKVITK